LPSCEIAAADRRSCTGEHGFGFRDPTGIRSGLINRAEMARGAATGAALARTAWVSTDA
jgi:hypothetical protein